MSLAEMVKDLPLVNSDGKMKSIFDYQRDVLLLIDDYPILNRDRKISADQKIFLERVRKQII